MKIHFFGAAQGVTGSKFLLEFDDQKKVLMDCGLFQGLKSLRLRNREEPPFDPTDLTAIVLTHAHIDHSGYLPLVIKKGFKGPVYTTPGTRSLCQILLPDAGYLQEEEARYMNKHKYSKHHPALPLFTKEDGVAAIQNFVTKDFHESFEIFPGCEVIFHRAGHIIGSSWVSLTYQGKTIVFSGDVGRLNDLIMRPPESIQKADYLLIESTYGDRLHHDINPKTELADIVNRTVKRGGVLVIPAFAVGRTQVILHLLTQLRNESQIPSVPIYLNSPMATRTTKMFCDYPDEHRLDAAECEDLNEDIQFVKEPEDSKALNLKTDPMIIVAGSGMATGGRVIHHLKAFASDPKNTILFTGYQAAGTRGQAIVGGSREVKIHGQYIPIRAEVAMLDNLSAHADYEELIGWLKKSKIQPQKTFIVHGEPSAQDHFRVRLKDELGWGDVVIPELNESFEI
jgi:metallo-beta-lactamase family protein